LKARLAPIRRDTSPFTGGGTPKRASVFVEPELVVEVVFTERTDEGILRHPSYKGIRIDKGRSDVETG
jgi:bifunctional non-homologous end joining protein LigD